MPKKIDEVLKSIFEEFEKSNKPDQQKLDEKWTEITGPKIAKHTKAVIDKHQRLIIWVDQSTLAFELKQRYQQALVKRVEQALGGKKIKDVRIYVGQIR